LASNARKRAVSPAPELLDQLEAERDRVLRDLRPFSPPELAEWLGNDEKTLERWRREGTGPDFVPISRSCVRYRPQAVDRWLRSLERSNRSQVAA